MPEENEKVEDFVSLWKKKMNADSSKPSVIGETLDRLQQAEKENEVLRNKIQENINLISKTEEIFKTTINENERLKEEIKQARMIGGVKSSDIQQENKELSSKVQNLVANLTKKEEDLRISNNEINNLKKKIEAVLTTQNSAPVSAEINSIIQGLQSDISKKSSNILELENNIRNLKEENKTSSVEEKIPPGASSTTLEILCKDLQLDLNKYKKIVEKLKVEKTELQNNVKDSGDQIEPKKMKEFKQENKELKKELSKIQEALKKKSEELNSDVSTADLENNINELQNQLQNKDHLIAELKSTPKTSVAVQKGPMSDLIDELQSKINKLKLTIDEKNKIIEGLKST